MRTCWVRREWRRESPESGGCFRTSAAKCARGQTVGQTFPDFEAKRSAQELARDSRQSSCKPPCDTDWLGAAWVINLAVAEWIIGQGARGRPSSRRPFTARARRHGQHSHHEQGDGHRMAKRPSGLKAIERSAFRRRMAALCMLVRQERVVRRPSTLKGDLGALIGEKVVRVP